MCVCVVQAIELAPESKQYGLYLAEAAECKEEYRCVIELSQNMLFASDMTRMADKMRRDPVKRVALSECCLNAATASTVLRALADCPTVTILDLSRNIFADRGATVFAKLLRHHPSLRVVNLAGNEITALGALRLATALQHNTVVQSLDVSHNPLTGPGVVALANARMQNKHSELRDLKLGGVQLGDYGALALLMMMNQAQLLNNDDGVTHAVVPISVVVDLEAQDVLPDTHLADTPESAAQRETHVAR
jgi:hypothetical protein